MHKKSFFWGVLTGAVLTFVLLIIIGLANQNSSVPIKYLDQPVSYENKTKSTFKVFQVLGNVALATEASDRSFGDDLMFFGNTVAILGENFYNDQVITIRNPKRVGTYSYTTKGDIPMTVPVIQGY